MGHARLPRVVRLLDQASSAGSGPLPVTVGGQVRAGHHQGQSFQESHPPPPYAARIITEPRAVSQSFHPPPRGMTRPHWLDSAPDLTCEDGTSRYPMDDRERLIIRWATGPRPSARLAEAEWSGQGLGAMAPESAAGS